MSSAVGRQGLSGSSPVQAASASARTAAMPSRQRNVRSSAIEASMAASAGTRPSPRSAAAAQRSALDALPSSTSSCAPSIAIRG